MKLNLDLTPSLTAWAAKQADPAAAALEILEDYVKANDNPVGEATSALKRKVQELPFEMQFELAQVVGAAIWKNLNRSHKVTFGKHVKANAASYGLEWVDKSASNHAIYIRLKNA
jgi:hypothetical protein